MVVPTKTRVGAIIRNKYYILMVFQSESKKWGIPKGKIENGEVNDDALYREIMEETGLKMNELDIKNINKIEYDQYYLTEILINNKVLPLVIPNDKSEIKMACWMPLQLLPSEINSATKIALNKFKLGFMNYIK